MREKSVDPKYGPMLNDQDVADRLGWSKNTLQQRRAERKPVPDYIKFSVRTCLTPETAVTRFMDAYFVSAHQA